MPAPFRAKDIYENTTAIGVICSQMVDFQIPSHTDYHHHTYFHNTASIFTI